MVKITRFLYRIGEGTDVNVSDFQVQIKSMSSVLPVTHTTTIMILVSLVTLLINSFTKRILSTALKTQQ